MLCRNAMVENVVSAQPDQTIHDALGLFEKHQIRAVPIVSADGILIGRFTFDVMLSNLLPGPLMVDSHELRGANLRLDYTLDAEPDVAKHLKQLLNVALGDLLDDEVQVVHPDTPLWEGIRCLVKYGSPIPVVEEQTRKLVGLLSVQSATARLVELVSQAD